MRLHSLAVCAFGPFPGTVSVDFDDVCSAGLFLIHGATGSGKTSLLDAICFALFADVPGARTKKGLASHHAEAGTRPLVALDFTASGRRFRVERSPEFHRPKKRGSGLLKVNAAVVLEELRGEGWVPVSTRHDEVAHLLDDVLGMGLAQFAKVVVLPQGDVSAFLRSSPEDRRALLERLFDISTYTDVESWLTEERRRSGAGVEDALAGIVHELGRLADLGNGPDELLSASMPVEEVPAALASASAALSAEVSELLAAADAAEGACSAAAAALHEARTLAGLRERGARARAVRLRAAEQAGQIDAARRRIQLADAAEAIAGHLAALDVAVAEESRAAHALAAQRASLSGAVSPHASAGELVERLERLQSAAPLLSELAHAQGEAGKDSAAVSSCRSALEAAELDARAAADQVAVARESHAALERELEGVTLLAAGHPSAEAAHSHAVRMLRLAEQVTELARAREAATLALVDAGEDLLNAQTELLALRERQLTEVAGTLASRLVEGAPCPVCGSADHPAPAHGAAAVTVEELQGAEEKHAAALTLVTELRQADAAAASRITTLLEQLADHEDSGAGGGADGPVGAQPGASDPGRLDLEMLSARAAQSAVALTEAAQAQRARDGARRAEEQASALVLAAEHAEQMALRARAVAQAASDSAVARHRDQREALRQLMQRHRAECGCVEGDEMDVAHVVRLHGDLSDRIERVIAAERAHSEALSRRQDRREAADRAAADRDFPSVELAREAQLGRPEIDALRRRVTDHDQAVAVADATLAEDPVARALVLPEPDLEAAAENDRMARRAVREAQAAHSSAESRLMQLTTVGSDVTGRIDQLGALRARARAVKDLADAVGGTGGGNELRMRLSSFVLAARLEKVVALANERLRTMDAGRYLLEHSDAKVAGGGRSGLDLRVLDQWTGRTRETASLSGGESFMVSLALALGLADTVREESGGFDLGTLFVDEGFGTLDDDSLEQVMGVLDDLREGGRAVGVVSHVADLRARISHQVVVQKSTSGSVVRVEISA